MYRTPVFLQPLLSFVILAKLALQNLVAWTKRSGKTEWVCAIGDFNANERARYAKEVFDDYFNFSGISKNLSGKRVLEIGPGESLSVGILCLANGAKSVTAIDRFPSLLNRKQQSEIYKALIQNEKNIETGQFLNLIDNDFKISADKMDYIPFVPLEELDKTLAPGQFDIILSRAVLEHIYDLDLAFSSMNNLLAPGGVMIHEVDFRDHAIFTSYNLHPLTFLTFSKKIWKVATHWLGAPNRKLENYFRQLLNHYGFSYKIFKILAVGSEKKFHAESLELGKTHDDSQLKLVESIKPKLAAEYKSLSNEDLLTSGIFFTATK